MYFRAGDIVFIQARVIEDFDADARIEIADSRGRYSICIDKALIAREGKDNGLQVQ